jgi:hypothetical protein
MKKNVRLSLRITSDLLNSLRKESQEQETSIANLCREKLNNRSQLNKIESLIMDIQKRIK